MHRYANRKHAVEEGVGRKLYTLNPGSERSSGLSPRKRCVINYSCLIIHRQVNWLKVNTHSRGMDLGLRVLVKRRRTWSHEGTHCVWECMPKSGTHGQIAKDSWIFMHPCGFVDGLANSGYGDDEALKSGFRFVISVRKWGVVLIRKDWVSSYTWKRNCSNTHF